MIDLPLVLLSAAAVFAAGLVQGVTGFGFVIVAAPVLTIYLDPELAVPVLLLQSVVLNGAIMLDSYRWLNVRRVWLLMLMGALFTPVGAALLVTLDAAVIRLVVGAVVGVTSVAMLLGLQRTAGREQLVSAPVGAVSGVLGGATGLSGAPVMLFYTNQEVDPRESRANIVFYVQLMNAVALPSFAVGGLLTGEALLLSAELLPGSLVGVVGGIWLASRVPVGLFKRLSLVIVLLAGIGAAVSGIAG
jgi:uncharacterized membrane protein YfcA